jgi:hypothetical protein
VCIEGAFVINLGSGPIRDVQYAPLKFVGTDKVPMRPLLVYTNYCQTTGNTVKLLASSLASFSWLYAEKTASPQLRE